MLFIAWAFRSEWRRGTEDTESYPAVSSWRVTDHIKPILCVWSITLMDADIIPYPGSRCLIALQDAAACQNISRGSKAMSHHYLGLLKVLKGRIQKLCGDFEWYSMHHHVLWLPKPLIGRWCNRTYPNPGELILMTIWALSDCLCSLVWRLARSDSEDTALQEQAKGYRGLLCMSAC